jgi:pimeloyl-ACP methyl ester carboxylesterase
MPESAIPLREDNYDGSGLKPATSAGPRHDRSSGGQEHYIRDSRCPLGVVLVTRIWSVAIAGAAVAALTAGALSTASAAPAPSHEPSASATGALDRFYAQRVTWTDCGEDLQCGTVKVPLDYREPTGMTIDLAVNRLVTAGPAAPSLLVNPGGPGESGVDLVNQSGATLLMPSTPSVQAAYNVVGFDPRGVGASFPLVCITPADIIAGTQSVPVTAAEVKATVREAADLGRDCYRIGKGLMSNIGTEMVARDLDIIRAALGEAKLTYLGMSYGTFIGSTYAQLFPGKVGRMILDGVEIPTGTFPDLMKAQAHGYEDALADWAAGCSTREICPLLTTDGTPVELTALVQNLLQQLAKAPAPVQGAAPITQSDLISMMETSLTLGESESGWILLDAVLYGLTHDNAAGVAPIRDVTLPTPNALSANVSVQCYDRPTAGTVATSVGWSKAWASFAPVFGPTLGWAAQSCFTWPVRRGQPPVDATPLTQAPVLLIGGTHDPNTPYWMAQKTTPMYAAGRLLTWTGYGHVASNRGIPCVNNPAAQYLITGALPDTGTVCVPDSTPSS